MLGLLIVLTVSLLVVFKVDTNNIPTCSVFIKSCSLTDAPLASSSKDYIIKQIMLSKQFKHCFYKVYAYNTNHSFLHVIVVANYGTAQR